MRLLKSIRKKLSRYRITVTKVSGRERESGFPLDLVLIGSGMNMDKFYLLGQLYGEQVDHEEDQRIWHFQIPEVIRKSEAEMIMGYNVPLAFRRYADRGCAEFYIPRWLGGEVSVEDALNEIEHRPTLRADNNKLKKNGLTYVMSDNLEDYRWYYDNIYVPYVNALFGRTSAPVDFRKIEEAMPDLTLMLVKKDGETVAGQILVLEGKKARGWTMGLLNGDRTLAHIGALAALYIFGFQELAKRGIESYNLGGSRPFINDGVLQYKRKWGMVVNKGKAEGFVICRIRDTQSVRQVLHNNPFIYEATNGKLTGAVFFPDHQTDHQTVCKQIKPNSFLGLQALELYTTISMDLEEGCKVDKLKQPLVNKSISAVFIL